MAESQKGEQEEFETRRQNAFLLRLFDVPGLG